MKAHILSVLYLWITIHSARTDQEGDFKLHIEPEPDNAVNVLVKRVDDELNLTCTISATHLDVPAKYKLAWYLPLLSQNSQNRVSKVQGFNSLQLTVRKLQEADSGEYACEVNEEHMLHLRHSIRVHVKPRRNYCSERHFLCATGECIARRFVCDGYKDCKDATDEAQYYCGKNPCEGKLRCEDGRCMSSQLCCNIMKDPNCTVQVQPSCCFLTNVYEDIDSFNKPHFGDDINKYTTSTNSMDFHKTVYVFAGCAMVVLFIGAFVTLAICRVHIKRSVMSHFPNSAAAASLRRSSPSNSPVQNDWDFYLAANDAAVRPSGLLVTYNINNGVQFLGMPLQPPPYCEVLTIPPREGPPPPYTSTEHLPMPDEPLLAENQNNNNGDINGNSTDGVVPQPDNNGNRTTQTNI